MSSVGMTKIVQLVNSCRECPNRHYYSGGTYECMKVQPSRLNADMSIPAWCPLTDYPAATVSPDTDGMNLNDTSDVAARQEGKTSGLVDLDEDTVRVPLMFLREFLALAHNYSLTAEPPDFYDGLAGDAFRNAYARCGRDLAALRSMLVAHGVRACDPACSGNDSESHCVRTNSPYCGVTNPPGTPTPAALDAGNTGIDGGEGGSCTYPDCACVPNGDVGCNNPNAAARGLAGGPQE